MAKFPNRAELYRLIQRELPEGAYPDGPASAFFSTADSEAAAEVFGSAYEKLRQIYLNYFPQSATDEGKQQDWEIFVFGETLDSSLSLAERRQRVIDQLRLKPTLDLWFIMMVVLASLPDGVTVQIRERAKFQGGWRLGEGQLGFTTQLGYFLRFILANTGHYCDPTPLFPFWTLGVSQLGLNTTFPEHQFVDGDADIFNNASEMTALFWAYQQINAYAYEVRVFEHTLTEMERTEIEKKLRRFQPARSDHLLLDNQQFATYFLNTVVTDIDQSSNVDCVKKDPLSSTGFSGRTQDGE